MTSLLRNLRSYFDDDSSKARERGAA